MPVRYMYRHNYCARCPHCNGLTEFCSHCSHCKRLLKKKKTPPPTYTPPPVYVPPPAPPASSDSSDDDQLDPANVNQPPVQPGSPIPSDDDAQPPAQPPAQLLAQPPDADGQPSDSSPEPCSPPMAISPAAPDDHPFPDADVDLVDPFPLIPYPEEQFGDLPEVPLDEIPLPEEDPEEEGMEVDVWDIPLPEDVAEEDIPLPEHVAVEDIPLPEDEDEEMVDVQQIPPGRCRPDCGCCDQDCPCSQNNLCRCICHNGHDDQHQPPQEDPPQADPPPQEPRQDPLQRLLPDVVGHNPWVARSFLPLPRNLPDVVPLFEHRMELQPPRLRKEVHMLPPKLKRVQPLVLNVANRHMEPPVLVPMERPATRQEPPALPMERAARQEPPALVREESAANVREVPALDDSPLFLAEIPPLGKNIKKRKRAADDDDGKIGAKSFKHFEPRRIVEGWGEGPVMEGDPPDLLRTLLFDFIPPKLELVRQLPRRSLPRRCKQAR